MKIRMFNTAVREETIELGVRSEQEATAQAPPRQQVRRARKHAPRKRHALVSVDAAGGFLLFNVGLNLQPGDTALVGSKLACQAPLILAEGDLQRCAVEKDADSVADLNTCEV